jgi:hypothetical protein
MPFYAASEWEALDGARTLVCAAGGEQEYHLSRMMLFISGKGKAARRLFAEQPMRVTHTW